MAKLRYTTFAEFPVMIPVMKKIRAEHSRHTLVIFSVKRAETEWDFVIGHLCKSNLKVFIQQSSHKTKLKHKAKLTIKIMLTFHNNYNNDMLTRHSIS